MDVGRLSNRIDIYRTTSVGGGDDIGGFNPYTQFQLSVSASVVRKSGNRTQSGVEVENVEVYEFVFRTNAYEITTADTIKFASKSFTIHSVDTPIKKNYTKVIAYTKKGQV